MRRPIEVPSAGEYVGELADWVELTTLQADDRNTSLQDVIRVLRRSGTPGDLADGDQDPRGGDAGSERSEAVAENAFSELDRRASACGDQYPFELKDGLAIARSNADSRPYVFLLLLSKFGTTTKAKEALRLFEEVCAVSAESYLGGPRDEVATRAFGFPRRYKEKDFPNAIAELCTALGEGGGHSGKVTIDDQKDGGLDVVAWRGFLDRLPGKLIAFGQCACGDNWRKKLTELHVESFCRLWMRQPPYVNPIPLFFLPRTIDPNLWESTCRKGGVLFDRCRIAGTLGRASDQLSAEWEQWSAAILSKKVRAT